MLFQVSGDADRVDASASQVQVDTLLSAGQTVRSEVTLRDKHNNSYPTDSKIVSRQVMDSSGQLRQLEEGGNITKTGEYRVFVKYAEKLIQSSGNHLSIQAGEATSLRLHYRIKNPLSTHYSYVPLLPGLTLDNQ